MTLRVLLLFVAALAKPLTLSQVWTLDGVYNDRPHGVSFRYPTSWQAETRFAQQPPLLTQSEVAAPLAGFAYSEGGFPRSKVVGPYSDTNLEGFGIVYSVVAAASASACESEAASVSASQKNSVVTFGGRSFRVYATAEAGMSQSLTGKLYATYVGANCYLFETDVAVVAPGVVDNVKALTSAQQQAIDAGLEAIMKSVQISSPE
jgi:hypothetical protein